MSFTLHGLAVSGGIAIGHAHLISHAVLEVTQYQLRERDVADELKRLDAALATARDELDALREEANNAGSPGELSAFIDLHSMLLADQDLTAAVHSLIRDGRCNAEWAMVLSHRSRTPKASSAPRKAAAKKPAVKKAAVAKKPVSAQKPVAAKKAPAAKKAAAKPPAAKKPAVAKRAAAKPAAAKKPARKTAASTAVSTKRAGSSPARRMAKAVGRLGSAPAAATGSVASSNGLQPTASAS